MAFGWLGNPIVDVVLVLNAALQVIDTTSLRRQNRARRRRRDVTAAMEVAMKRLPRIVELHGSYAPEIEMVILRAEGPWYRDEVLDQISVETLDHLECAEGVSVSYRYVGWDVYAAWSSPRRVLR